ncbi:MAG: lamin tail domain-containing protein [Chloroflexi bacterium]|nr:lamin tail domain-containing protein [Chloroflexota bacterium]
MSYFRAMLLLMVMLITACNTEIEVASPVDFDMPDRPANLEEARVRSVADGDTLTLEDGRRVRLIGINAPETGQFLYEEAGDFLRGRVDNKTIYLEFDEEPLDQFDRLLAYVWLDDSLVNIELLLSGYAASYFVPPNMRYINEFDQAERAAMSEGIGLWVGGDAVMSITTIVYDAPGPDDENLNGEWVEFRNDSEETVNLRGFTLRDTSSTNLYVFGSVNLPAGSTLRIYSGCGQDTATEVYWCNDTSIWNNSGDTATLRDVEERFLATYSY